MEEWVLDITCKMLFVIHQRWICGSIRGLQHSGGRDVTMLKESWEGNLFQRYSESVQVGYGKTCSNCTTVTMGKVVIQSLRIGSQGMQCGATHGRGKLQTRGLVVVSFSVNEQGRQDKQAWNCLIGRTSAVSGCNKCSQLPGTGSWIIRAGVIARV